MSSLKLGGPGGPELEPARLQPAADDFDNDAERAEARNVDRRLGDRDLLAGMRRAGFEGPDYRRVAEELVRYGHAVITAWIVRRSIFEKCARRGTAVRRPPPGSLDEAEVESLANEVVTVALNHFRDEVLIPGRWDPAKGASLTTFFVGQCLIRFPNIYSRWHRALPRHDVEEAAVQGDRRAGERAVEEQVIAERLGSEALRLVRRPDARRALVLHSIGYTHAEIADDLGTTDKAVERMIDYARQQVQRAMEESA